MCNGNHEDICQTKHSVLYFQIYGNGDVGV